MVSPQLKKLFLCLKDRLELQREREMKVDTGDPQFIEFLKYGNGRDYNKGSLSRSLGDTKLFNKKTEMFLYYPQQLQLQIACKPT